LSKEITLDVVDATAVITLRAPARRNALTGEMADDLCAALEEASRRDHIGALVLQAEGPVFCAGADTRLLSSAAADPAEEANYQLISRVYDAFYLVGQARIPTIAAARGACIGAGLNLLMAADLRIVASDIRLLSGFLARGLHPGGGHIHLLARTAGREAAAALALFGAEIDGVRAVQLGLAWESVEASEVESRALQIASVIAQRPDLARRVVRSFRAETDGFRMGWEAAKEFERPSQMWSMRNNGR
jgi:enoyl-CoA hydratase